MARKRYSKGKRVDMRKGGRVGLARGKGVKPKKKAKVAKNTPSRPQPRPQQPQGTQATIPPAQQQQLNKKGLAKSNRLAIEEPVGEPSTIPTITPAPTPVVTAPPPPPPAPHISTSR